MTTRKTDAKALVEWAQAQGAAVRRSRRGWVIRLHDRQVAVIHLSPSRDALSDARADVERALRDAVTEVDKPPPMREYEP
jgi:hypothetical protein